MSYSIQYYLDNNSTTWIAEFYLYSRQCIEINGLVLINDGIQNAFSSFIKAIILQSTLFSMCQPIHVVVTCQNEIYERIAIYDL